ncbi:MAG: DUF6072 family protein [Pyrinomonadaceae bacterium]
MKVDFKQAGLHLGLNLVARALLGPAGTILVSTNAVVKAVTGRHLHEHLSAMMSPPAERAPTTPPAGHAKTPRQLKRARLDSPDAPGDAAVKSEERPPPSRKSRAKSTTKRRKASGSRSTA